MKKSSDSTSRANLVPPKPIFNPKPTEKTIEQDKQKKLRAAQKQTSKTMARFETGGSLPKGGDGLKFDADTKTKKAADKLKKLTPADLLNEKISYDFSGVTNEPETWEGQNTKVKAASATQGSSPYVAGDVKTDKAGDGKGDKKKRYWEDYAQYAKYPMIAAGVIAANKAADKAKGVKYTPANLMTGSVRDLARPNMKLRHNTPVGNDLQQHETSQKLGDAIGRDAELDYQTRNAMSRLAQQDQIVQNTNRNTMFNTQNKQHADMFNAQLRGNVQAQKSANILEGFLGAHHNLQGDLTSSVYNKTLVKTNNAGQVLHTAEEGSDEYTQAQKDLGMKQRNGGKLRYQTKFNGRIRK